MLMKNVTKLLMTLDEVQILHYILHHKFFVDNILRRIFLFVCINFHDLSLPVIERLKVSIVVPKSFW